MPEARSDRGTLSAQAAHLLLRRMRSNPASRPARLSASHSIGNKFTRALGWRGIDAGLAAHVDVANIKADVARIQLDVGIACPNRYPLSRNVCEDSFWPRAELADARKRPFNNPT